MKSYKRINAILFGLEITIVANGHHPSSPVILPTVSKVIVHLLIHQVTLRLQNCGFETRFGVTLYTLVTLAFIQPLLLSSASAVYYVK